MTCVVAFHVAPSEQATQRIANACSTFHADNDYLGLLNILFRSAKLRDAGAQCVVLTDESTDMSSLEADVRVIRSPIDADRVMLSRLQAQIEFLERQTPSQNTLFVDADMIINAPLDSFFADNFDLALTYRADPAMPINGGVIMVKGGRAAAAIGFLQRVCDSYRDKFASQSHWWGDQHALIDVLGSERFAHRTSDLLEVEGTRIRLLPCERYNFSPDNRLQTIARPLSSKAILHFKGERKRLMPLYWEAHLSHRYQSGWRAMWHAHRTRWKLRSAA